MKLDDFAKFAFCIGFIQMLDAHLIMNQVPVQQRMLKKNFLIKESILQHLPNTDPQAIADYLEQINQSKIGVQLISIMQKKIDRDQMMKDLNNPNSYLGQLFKGSGK